MKSFVVIAPAVGICFGVLSHLAEAAQVDAPPLVVQGALPLPAAIPGGVTHTSDGNDEASTSPNVIDLGAFVINDLTPVDFRFVVNETGATAATEYRVIGIFINDSSGADWTSVDYTLGFDDGAGGLLPGGAYGLDFDFAGGLPDAGTLAPASANFLDLDHQADRLRFTNGIADQFFSFEFPSFVIDVPALAAVPTTAVEGDQYAFTLRFQPNRPITARGAPLVPEPATLGLMLFGLLGACVTRPDRPRGSGRVGQPAEAGRTR